MTAALEERIARVFVRSQHPELTDAKIDQLVALGVGRATAALVAEEVRAVEQEERTPVIGGRCPSTWTDVRGEQHHCTLLDGHGGTGHFERTGDPPDFGSRPLGPVRPPGAERLGPLRPEPATPAEVERLAEVLETIARPPVHLADLPEPDPTSTLKVVSTPEATLRPDPTRPIFDPGLVCFLFGHRWVQLEGVFTARHCRRCGKR